LSLASRFSSRSSASPSWAVRKWLWPVMVAMAARAARVTAAARRPVIAAALLLAVVATVGSGTIAVIVAAVVTLRPRRHVPLRPVKPRLPAATVLLLPPLLPPRPLRRLLKLRSPAPRSYSALRWSTSAFVVNHCQPIGLADFFEWEPALSFSTQKGDTPKPDLSQGSGFFFYALPV
jgi:hypothetical protein